MPLSTNFAEAIKLPVHVSHAGNLDLAYRAFGQCLGRVVFVGIDLIVRVEDIVTQGIGWDKHLKFVLDIKEYPITENQEDFICVDVIELGFDYVSVILHDKY
jgi:hypothetical protein